MPAEYNGVAPSKTAIDNGVHEAFAREGYVNEDGSNDKARMRECILQAILNRGKVLAKGERAEKAISRGELVTEVFPSLPAPDTIDSESDPTLTAAVVREVGRLVWGETRPGADGAVQRLVGVTMGNGYVLCRTKIGPDTVAAVYVTDDIACIQTDFTRPENDAIERRVKMATRNREMLVLRQPQNAAKYARNYASTLRQISVTAGSQIQLALAAVSDNGNDVDGEGDEDSE